MYEWCNGNWANYQMSTSPYCMIYRWWETERETWSWSCTHFITRTSTQNKVTTVTKILAIENSTSNVQQVPVGFCKNKKTKSLIQRQSQRTWENTFDLPFAVSLFEEETNQKCDQTIASQLNQSKLLFFLLLIGRECCKTCFNQSNANQSNHTTTVLSTVNLKRQTKRKKVGFRSSSYR